MANGSGAHPGTNDHCSEKLEALSCPELAQQS